ncbi:MAG: serine hydrolase [Burkholderiaceae bacterium]
MNLSTSENLLAQRVDAAIEGVTPGVVLQAYRRGDLLCECRAGSTHDYYDLASLTKVVFTQQVLMQAFDQGRWAVDSRVANFLPDFPHGQIRLVDLMTHTSGMTWWKPLYECIALDGPREQKRRWLYDALARDEVVPTGKAVYSDLGFMLLGFLLERMHGRDLLAVWDGLRERSYPDTALAFSVDNTPSQARARYAPTEVCPWRGKRLQGEVHDDNTWALGGVSTHAGLFGGMNDLAAFGRMLRAQVLGLPGSGVRLATAQWFSRRAIDAKDGDWALGFMLPSATGASCGRHFSVASIGHTGFTGTSVWFDPQNDLLVLILSNRVALGRENRSFIDLRPRLHDWVCELFCPDMACVR